MFLRVVGPRKFQANGYGLTHDRQCLGMCWIGSTKISSVRVQAKPHGPACGRPTRDARRQLPLPATTATLPTTPAAANAGQRGPPLGSAACAMFDGLSRKRRRRRKKNCGSGYPSIPDRGRRRASPQFEPQLSLRFLPFCGQSVEFQRSPLGQKKRRIRAVAPAHR